LARTGILSGGHAAACPVPKAGSVFSGEKTSTLTSIAGESQTVGFLSGYINK
jgi:hypothetical protein